MPTYIYGYRLETVIIIVFAMLKYPLVQNFSSIRASYVKLKANYPKTYIPTYIYAKIRNRHHYRVCQVQIPLCTKFQLNLITLRQVMGILLESIHTYIHYAYICRNQHHYRVCRLNLPLSRKFQLNPVILRQVTGNLLESIHTYIHVCSDAYIRINQHHRHVCRAKLPPCTKFQPNLTILRQVTGK